MGNPLGRFFPVDERRDGVFITVTPDNKAGADIRAIERVLIDEMVINYDLGLIKEVIERASGEPELVGPPFEFYDLAFDKYVDVNISRQMAAMRINSACFEENCTPTVETVLFCLKRKGIRYGISRKKVAEALKGSKFDVEVPVAFAKDPVPGEDASIKFEIELNPDLKPQKKEDGSVDYRNIHSFVQLGKDQVIATKIPPTSGIPGISVTGEKIPSTAGKDMPFPNGSNTYISEDGCQLLASRSGVLKREGNQISVTEELAVNKNVDFSVGNLKHAGDIVIGGDVMPGFTVEAEGNITIKGQVESARIISRNGKVIINQGIIGKGEAYIYGKAGIEIAFAQEATLETDGVLKIERNCLHSNSTCQICSAVERQSSIVGGTLKAGKHIEVRQVGNEKLVETRLCL
ncbi:MAG: DUF342 domain-containing protein, partial [Chitinivibrionales bacterium]|nr:DUF342 domain-containing protein [Chitinivibrionales bacterium]